MVKDAVKDQRATGAQRRRGHRLRTADVRALLRPSGLDQEIRRPGSGARTTNITFSRPEHAQSAAAIIAQAWGAHRVVIEAHRHFGLARVKIERDVRGDD